MTAEAPPTSSVSSTLAEDAAGALGALGARPATARGRLGVYVLLGASADAIPLPWLPDSLLLRVRGALVHDCVARHGASLTGEAREVLANPSGSDDGRGLAARALSFVALRVAFRLLARFGPVGVVWPLRQAVRMYLLGHLFERYLEVRRTDRAVRIDAEEARRVRLAIDGAIARAFSVDVAAALEAVAVDDQRDPMTVLVDGVLAVAAGLPDRLTRRIDAAFDELLTKVHG